MAEAGQAAKYVSYCEKRMKRPDGPYTLFWVQDTKNRDTLAIVGKGSKYRTPPEFRPAYTASSKVEVLGWLASIGAERQLTDKAARVPKLSEEDWISLQPKSKKGGTATKQPSSKSAQTPGRPLSKPLQQQQQHQHQPQRVPASQVPQAHHSNTSSAAAAGRDPASQDQGPKSRKPVGRPRKRAKTREVCMYCSKTTHASDDCPIKIAAEEGSEAEISDDDPVNQDDALHEPAAVAPSSEDADDAEESDREEEDLQPAPPKAPAVAVPLRHEHVVRRNPGREASFSPEVQEAYQHNPELMKWVSGSLDQEGLDTLTRWSTELTGIVSPTPPKTMYLDNDGQQLRWLSTDAALDILRQLQTKQINLRMLELSQISMPVAMLRNNANQEVQMLARGLAKKWRELAVAALDCATKALEGKR